ncbi:hypothetical protein GO002_12380 [Streptomyces eurocidicus]|uniref:Uncharacterized protein n=1 Tax=Streptomyces eurocidicus TaxID=66423 RepID=A0A7W8F034_STREU|nr:hypothetical protein [Streptomyces eurocidicus]MBB5117017.1 hypothetical protein [Streptomyces eurocidicus]MBF6052685.1 hypothetical protein [Streptomyces eurocidicus]
MSSATDHSRAAGVLLLCRAEPDRVRPSAQLLNEPLLLVPAGEGWSALIPGEDSWRSEGTSLAEATAGWAHALAVAESWPVVGVWWDASGAGFVVAAGFRRTVGYHWLADGTPAGAEPVMGALRARLGLDPVLDGAALDGLARPDSDAGAAARVLGLIAVLSRTGLTLPPGLAPGVSAARLRAAAGVLPAAEAVDWPGWRQAVRAGLDAAERGTLGAWTRGPRARALGAAEIAAGLALAFGARRAGRRGWAAVGAVLAADGALTLAYDWWRERT